LADTFYPQAARAMLRVVERLGGSWSCPDDQTCCGQPMFNAGYFDQARQVARRFIEVFEQTEGPILCPSASCTAMVRHHYLTLFENDPDWLIRARDVGERTFEFSEFLIRREKIDLRKLGAAFSESVTYHYSCHLRMLNVTDEPIKLIQQIGGIDYRPLEKIDQCCGFGGTFSVNFPHLSEALVKNKVQTILDTGADWLIFSDAGCAMNMTGYANRIGRPLRAMHLAELLAKSLGVSDE
jgi:L-lactate dehydrogenase complex protein LldE